MSENVMLALVREVRRVERLRARYEQLEKDFSHRRVPGGPMHTIDVKPALRLMDHTLERAEAAAGSGDALKCVAALQALRGFES